MSEHDERTGLGDFVAELRRRHVVRFAVTYGAAAFVVLQLAEIVFPAFGIGESGLRLLVIVTTLGFPPSLVLAWVYDLSRDGIQRTDGSTSRALHHAAVGTLLLATVAATGGLGLYLARQEVVEAARSSIGGAVISAAYDPSEPIRSIAVLPLDDYSPDEDQAYFTSSMHEELIAKLSMLDEIRVVSRTTVMRYADSDRTAPEIGRELDVDVIVEGSVTRSGERTRVTLQIIHAPSDSHIETLQWDEEDVEDVLAFQTEIARRVVAAVSGDYDSSVMAAASGDVAPEAQDAYFRGRYAYEQGTPEGYRTAMEFFQEAVAADPDFAPAMAGLAGARFLVGLDEEEFSEVEISRARDEAVAALQMDSASVEAREVVSLIERSMPRVMPAAPVIPAPQTPDAEPRMATVVMPGDTDTLRIDMQGFDTAWVASMTTLGERIEERVRRWTPDGAADAPPDPRREMLAAHRYLNAGRFDDATRALEQVLLDAPELDPAWASLVHAHVARGDVDAVLGTVRAWHESGAPEGPTAEEVDALESAVADDGRDGYWAWQLERLQQQRDEGRRVPGMDVATAHAALGHDAEAVEELLAAVERGEPDVVRVRTDPAWDDLRSEPRVRTIARQAEWLRTRRPRGPGADR